ncbi:MAG TPA: L-fucose:H+ symporter permease [Bacteroidota bacterium]|nr:L-fucose:H+ symporter permease [Bacteroidota bacterium]
MNTVLAPSAGDRPIAHDEANYTPALTILTSLFFMWGFITCLNDILIPHLKTVFSLNYTEVMLIQFTFFTAYFIVSLPSGLIVDKIGYKRGIVIGLLTAGIGCLLFYPAAGTRSYPIFLFALFVLASGITLLQVSANPYVAILGKPETASARLNLTQAFNSLGTTIAPYFGSLLILSVAAKSAEELAAMSPDALSAYQLAEAASVQVPYLGLAAALLVIAAIFAVVKLPQIQAHPGEASEATGLRQEDVHASAWKFRHLMLGAVAIFVYVGGEVSIGSFLVNFMGQKDIAGLPAAEAGKYLSFYWGGAMVGRFIGAGVLRKIRPGTVLGFNAVVAATLVVIAMIASGFVSMWALLAVGLFNSIMFPTIFTLGVDGLGRHTGQGSGILCMAIVGGAIVPLLQGVFADQIGIHHAFFLPVLCYIYIAYYGFKGHIPSFHRKA